MAKSKEETLASEKRSKNILTATFAIICLVWVLPVVAVIINSFKKNASVKTETFALPTSESFNGWNNFIKGMTFGNYPFAASVVNSVIITVISVALILVFCSMAAWYI